MIAASAAALGVSIGPAMAADGQAVPGRAIGAGGTEIPNPNVALPAWLTHLVPAQNVVPAQSARPPIQMYRPVVGPAGGRPDGGTMTRRTARPNDPTWTLVPESAVPGQGSAVEPRSGARPVGTVAMRDAELVPPDPTWTVVRPGSATRQAEHQPPQDPTWT